MQTNGKWAAATKRVANNSWNLILPCIVQLKYNQVERKLSQIKSKLNITRSGCRGPSPFGLFLLEVMASSELSFIYQCVCGGWQSVLWVDVDVDVEWTGMRCVWVWVGLGLCAWYCRWHGANFSHFKRGRDWQWISVLQLPPADAFIWFCFVLLGPRSSHSDFQATSTHLRVGPRLKCCCLVS